MTHAETLRAMSRRGYALTFSTLETYALIDGAKALDQVDRLRAHLEENLDTEDGPNGQPRPNWAMTCLGILEGR